MIQIEEKKSKMVFVLGAGFTKAFATNAPTLQVGVTELKFSEIEEKYRKFGNIVNLLANFKEKAGLEARINVEELMTRLSLGMPFDNNSILEGERKALLEDVKDNFFNLIQNIEIDKDKIEILNNFSKYLIENSISCITFNYDTLLDKHLWMIKNFHTIPMGKVNYFHPDGGYGFFCRPAEHLVVDGNSTWMDHCTTILYKLHGSLNWRVKIGSRIPYTVDSLVHDENWLTSDGLIVNLRESDKESHLEKNPFIISPVLDKSEIGNQSVLKVVWSAAYKKLKESEKIIFIGYSLPVTDISAKFLFKESLLGKQSGIMVVDYSTDPIYIDKIKKTYREIFPGLLDTQFCFDGGLKWIESNCVLLTEPVIEDLIIT